MTADSHISKLVWNKLNMLRKTLCLTRDLRGWRTLPTCSHLLILLTLHQIDIHITNHYIKFNFKSANLCCWMSCDSCIPPSNPLYIVSPWIRLSRPEKSQPTGNALTRKGDVNLVGFLGTNKNFARTPNPRRSRARFLHLFKTYVIAMFVLCENARFRKACGWAKHHWREENFVKFSEFPLYFSFLCCLKFMGRFLCVAQQPPKEHCCLVHC